MTQILTRKMAVPQQRLECPIPAPGPGHLIIVIINIIMIRYDYCYHYYYRVGREDTANLRTKILDSRGIDSSIILISRGGTPRPIGNFPGSLSQQISAGIISVRRSGAPKPLLAARRRLQAQRVGRVPGVEGLQGAAPEASPAARTSWHSLGTIQETPKQRPFLLEDGDKREIYCPPTAASSLLREPGAADACAVSSGSLSLATLHVRVLPINRRPSM